MALAPSVWLEWHLLTRRSNAQQRQETLHEIAEPLAEFFKKDQDKSKEKHEQQAVKQKQHLTG